MDKIVKVKWIVPNENPNHDYNCFLQQFLECYNECFRIIDTKARKTLQNKPLFTNELHKMCNKKCFYTIFFLKNPSEYRQNVYNQYRNCVNKELKRLSICI